MKRVVIIVVAVVLLGFGVLLARVVMRTSGTQSFPAAVASGALPVAPEFVLRQLNGSGSLALVSLRGSVVVVNFWASWCDPCKDEAPILQDVWVTDLQPQGDVFVGVVTQDLSDDARAFAKAYGLTYPLVHDDGGGVARAWGVGALPETFVLDRQGRAVRWFPGVVSAADLRAAIAEASK